MRHWPTPLFFLLLLAFAIPISATQPVYSDYPLRIYIFSARVPTSLTQHRRYVDQPVIQPGNGRATLFENGEPRGLDFVFDCGDQLLPNMGYETYPAKWKKKNLELVVLAGDAGDPKKTHTCNLKLQMKDFVYAWDSGRYRVEPASELKAWMLEHGYDPEHGKETPMVKAPKPATSVPAKQ